MAIFLITRCYKIEYKPTGAGSFTTIEGAFSFEYAINRTFSFGKKGDQAPTPRDLTIDGQILTSDFDIAETLADLTQHGTGPSKLPALQVYYVNNQETKKKKLFDPVIFCTKSPGSLSESEQDLLENIAPVIHRIPFIVSVDPEGLVSDVITTENV